MNDAEHRHQCSVAQYLDLKYPGLLWTASCGGMRTSIGAAVKMKKMGYKKGCPDIMVFEPRGLYHGLFVELKAPAGFGQAAGKIKPEQMEFLSWASLRGYKAEFAYGSQEACRIIDDYLKLVKPTTVGI